MPSEDQLKALSKFIDDCNGIFASTIPEELESLDDALFKTVETVDKCPNCGADILGPVEIDGEKVASCQGECGKIPHQETAHHKLDLNSVLELFSNRLGHEVTEDDVDTRPMPLYARTHLGDSLRLNLVCNTDRLEESVEKLFADAVRNSHVNAIVAPKSTLENIYQLAAEYPVASFAPAFSICMLDEPSAVVEVIENAVGQRDQSDETITQSDLQDEELAATIENNPGAIRTELAYSRVRREASLSPTTLGDYFERVCHAALMSLNISTKPLGESGKNVADLAFKFPSNNKRHGEEILGIVDTKSNGEKNLSEEKIADKHRDYIWQTTADRFENSHVAHVFVVFDMDGLDANEIDWYHLIQEEYRNAGVDGTMVILYASALSQMVQIAQSPLQTNELNLATDGMHEVFRPFFHSGKFQHSVEDEVRWTTRVDPNTSDKEAYINRYKECENLIVVLPEMVRKRYSNITDSDWIGDDEAALNRYPNPDY
jgi:hypothetical protein